VAKKVVDGLNIILTKEEEKKVTKKPTENAEAYELFLKGHEYFTRGTKSDFERALTLFEEAVRLDPKFAQAFAEIAIVSSSMYRLYIRRPEMLDRAEAAAKNIGELEGETAQYFWAMSRIALQRGDAEDALRFAKRAVEIDPTYSLGNLALGFAYQTLGMKEEAAQALEEYVRQRENDINAHFSLLVVTT